MTDVNPRGEAEPGGESLTAQVDTVVATPQGPVRVTRGSRPLLCKSE